MMAKHYRSKGIAMMLALTAVFAAGCANNPNYAANRVQQQGVTQQGVRMQQTATPPRTTADSRIQIANRAADNIARLNSVKQANVLVTRSNAYVAAAVNTNQGQITSDLEKQIAQQVRATDPTIQNVYVSTNPEFVDRVNRYVTDTRMGHPVAGFFDEFTKMVQRVFPNAQ